MAIYHLSAKIISRAKGKSAVCSAAYRHGEKMYFEREGWTVDYTHKSEVIATGLAIPADAPSWLREGIAGWRMNRASEFLWNQVENFEMASNAQLAREIEASLPRELSRDQNIQIIETFITSFTDRGMVVDWAYHDLDDNPHVHMMMTLRPLTEEGFGPKKVPVLDDDGKPLRKIYKNGSERIVYQPWAGDRRGEDLVEWRAAWASVVNEALAELGHEQRIDHRSYDDRGLALEPGKHVGVHASNMHDRGKVSERALQEEEKRARNIAYLEAEPAHLLHVIADKQAVFTETDIAAELRRYVPDDEAHARLLAKVLRDPELVHLSDAVIDPSSNAVVTAAKLTTRDMISVEGEMGDRAARLDAKTTFGVRGRHVDRALDRMNAKLSRLGGCLSDEQAAAIRAVTGKGALSSVVGLAGAGKSTMLEAAREAWEAQGYRVRGVSLSGKAVEELAQASGIRSRTIASLEARLDRGFDLFQRGDVLVVDEAGMVGSRQLARLLRAAEAGEAKVVLIGDPAQLQPISAGAAFRAIIERTGFTEIAGIRRQREAWMREASVDFARGRMGKALAAYHDHGGSRGYRRKDAAIDGLAGALLRDHANGLSVLGLAHSNKDVRALNDRVREKRLEAGALKDETVFKTARGTLSFAQGDRVVFLQNDADLGVKNGLLGTVQDHEKGRLRVALDNGSSVEVNDRRYGHIDHGYAVTVHKSQGATVDSVHFLATRSVTRNLAYVAMTRHRHRAALHYSRASFDMFEGGLVEALSRPDDKASTLDYIGGVDMASAVAFGERRGLNALGAVMRTVRAGLARQSLRLKALVDRLVRREPVLGADTSWLLPPVERFGQTVREAARERVLASPAFTEMEAALRVEVADIYRDASAAMRRFRQVLDAPGEDLRLVADALKNAPERLGKLKGSTGLLSGRRRRAERERVTRGLWRVRFGIRQFRSAYLNALSKEAALEEKHRSQLQVGVPTLGPAENRLLNTLDEVERQSVERFQGALETIKAADPEALSRVRGFYQALDKRLGGLTRFLNTSQGGKIASPSEDRHVLGKHRHQLEQAARVGRALDRAERLDRSRGLGLGAH